MTIDTEKLRALLAPVFGVNSPDTPPWRVEFDPDDDQPETEMPRGEWIILDANGWPLARTVDACLMDRAALIVAAVNALPELLDALGTAAQVSDRVRTIADEAFGPFPVEPVDESLTHIEQGIFVLRQRLATAAAERDKLEAALDAAEGALYIDREHRFTTWKERAEEANGDLRVARDALVTAKSERLMLARALLREGGGDGEGLTIGEEELAARIVAADVIR